MPYKVNQNQLWDDFNTTRQTTVTICKPLKEEDCVLQTIAVVSPPKWHLAHTTWFFESFVLKEFLEGYKLFNPTYLYLFNSYYNNKGERASREDRGRLSRPTVKEVLKYRDYVNEKMQELFLTELSQEALKVIEVGINHEQQHDELLVYDAKNILSAQIIPSSFNHNKYDLRPEKGKMNWKKIEEGLYEIGATPNEFCYDIETPRHKIFVEEARIADRLVNNKEYLEFMEDGGYENFNLWHAEAWEFICQNKIKSPLYWRKKEGEWYEYKLSGEAKLNFDLPVMHITYFEAAAFAAWTGSQLPTERHWEIGSSQLEWGQLWEWTDSAYLPYPKYKRPNGAIGEYNAKFAVNQKVLKGASVATPQNHSRPTYRNFFYTNQRWMFSGIRLMKMI